MFDDVFYLLQAFFYGAPVECIEKCVDVFTALCGKVIYHEGVFPDVHCEKYGKAAEVA